MTTISEVWTPGISTEPQVEVLLGDKAVRVNSKSPIIQLARALIIGVVLILAAEFGGLALAYAAFEITAPPAQGAPQSHAAAPSWTIN
jgi:hypothetical protein